jgi:transposase
MVHDLRLLLRLSEGRESDPTAAILDSRTLGSTPQSGSRGGYDGAKRKKGTRRYTQRWRPWDTCSPCACDTGQRAEARVRRRGVGSGRPGSNRRVGGVAYVDQGYTGERATEEAEAHGMRLEVVKHEEAKRGFVLLAHRWVVERDFAWASRFLGGWRRITRGCPPLWRGCTSSPSIASLGVADLLLDPQGELRVQGQRRPDGGGARAHREEARRDGGDPAELTGGFCKQTHENPVCRQSTCYWLTRQARLLALSHTYQAKEGAH